MPTDLELKWQQERETAPVIACPLTPDERSQIERTVKRFAQHGNVAFARRSERDQLAHAYGIRAKNMGWNRTPTPYYEDPLSDRFFLAGFDGKTWDEAKAEFEQAVGELK